MSGVRYVTLAVAVGIGGCDPTTPSAPRPATVASLPSGGRPGADTAAATHTPGPFILTGRLATARASHSATRLPSGKVLITGGLGVDYQPLISAELYDPETRNFSAAGDMSAAFGVNTTAVLRDGRVLIAGGGRAELYDPPRGTFSPTGNPISKDFGWRGSAVLLSDGRVLIAGNGRAEIYDPASGTFALAEAYAAPAPASVDAAVRLRDGTVLITGCTESCGAGTSQRYDPPTGQFRRTESRIDWLAIGNATLLADGKVLFVDGNDSNMPDLAELYDPATETFTGIGYTSHPHEFSAALRLLDGSVLITGGQLAGGDGSPFAERYLPGTREFVAAGMMVRGRHHHTATLLSDGSVLIAGGHHDWPGITSSAEIYPAAGTATP